MGWLAVAGSGVIAGVYVYTRYRGQSDQNETPLSSGDGSQKGIKTLQESRVGEKQNPLLRGQSGNVEALQPAAANVIRSKEIIDTEARFAEPAARPTPTNGSLGPSPANSTPQAPTVTPPPRPPPSLMAPPTITAMPRPPSRALAPPPPRTQSPPRLRPATTSSAPRLVPSTSLRPPPSGAASLRVPQTKVLSNTSMAPTLSTSTLHPSSRPSRRVILSPGHSPLDWACLTKSAATALSLRGENALDLTNQTDRLLRISPAQLKRQNGRKGRDAWTSFQNKVYNISAYRDFHPGGAGELFRGAGKESDKMFMEVHPWVNWDGMLGECMIGILVGDGEGEGERKSSSLGNGAGDLDEMD